jgi:DNA-binding LytR/AlgR family response regulator
MADVQMAESTSPRALVAEDEAFLRDELCEALADLWPELVVCARVGDGTEALRQWEQHKPEIAFLDIRMPGMSGLDVARQISSSSHVVFLTAYDQHAVEAFKYGAVDYLLKPLDRERLATTIERLRKRIGSTPAPLDRLLEALSRDPQGKPQYLRWITASLGQELQLITSDEICYFHADSKYTRVATADREALISRPIKELIELMDPADFWQIHRATIVNIRQIAGIARDYRGRLFVRLKGRKETLPVSESHAYKFRQM